MYDDEIESGVELHDPSDEDGSKRHIIFELDENSPTQENDHSEGLEGLDKIAQTDSGCSEESSGLK